MRGILDAGFVFWGLFLVFGLFVVAYLAWMRHAERAEASSESAWDQDEEGNP